MGNLSKRPSLTDLVAFSGSWYGATFFGGRDPFSHIHTTENGSDLYLGSMLLDDRENKLAADSWYRNFTLQEFRRKTSDNKLLVVQVIQDFEGEYSPAMKASLKALTTGTDADRNLTVVRLHLDDFSHDYKPPPEFCTAFKGIYNTNIKGQGPLNIYGHCKAGVNRSFRVMVAIEVLLKLADLGQAPSSKLITQLVWDSCKAIKKPSADDVDDTEIPHGRDCVDFKRGNETKQGSFISHLVAQTLGLSEDVTMSLSSDTLALARADYKSTLDQRRSQYSTFFGTVVGTLAPKVVSDMLGAVPIDDKRTALALVEQATGRDTPIDLAAQPPNIQAALSSGQLAGLFRAGQEIGALPGLQPQAQTAPAIKVK